MEQIFVAKRLFSELEDYSVLLVDRRSDQVLLQTSLEFPSDISKESRYFGKVPQSVYFSVRRNSVVAHTTESKVTAQPF